MKQIIVLLSILVFILILSTNVFAHHPAADMVDPLIYEMIEGNISEVHLDMTFDDMGGDTAYEGRSRESIASDEDGGADGDVDEDMTLRQEANEMADSEPSGPMSSQR